MGHTRKIRNDINFRVGTLLREQRILQNQSIQTVALKFKLEEAKVKSWEDGKSSPPCYVFHKMVSFYGETAMQAAWELDFQLQIEKYHRLTDQRDANQGSQSSAS